MRSRSKSYSGKVIYHYEKVPNKKPMIKKNAKDISTHFFHFVLMVYLKYVKETTYDLNQFGKSFIYPFWIIRSVFIWLCSPIFIFEYIIKQTRLYDEYTRLQKESYK